MDKKKIYFFLVTCLAVSLLLECLFAEPHYKMPWNIIPGADIAIGFVGGWLLIFIAKGVVAKFLQKREDYYDKEGEEKNG